MFVVNYIKIDDWRMLILAFILDFVFCGLAMEVTSTSLSGAGYYGSGTGLLFLVFFVRLFLLFPVWEGLHLAKLQKITFLKFLMVRVLWWNVFVWGGSLLLGGGNPFYLDQEILIDLIKINFPILWSTSLYYFLFRKQLKADSVART